MIALEEVDVSSPAPVTRNAVSFRSITPHRRKPAGIRIFAVSDGHDGAPYADSEDVDRSIDIGLEGYFDYDEKDKKIFVEHPARVCILSGDMWEVINWPGKKGPITIFKYSRLIDYHIDRLRKRILSHPDCKFIVPKGNHERMPEFDVSLKLLAEELGPDRLEIQPHIKAIGDGVYGHFDQAVQSKTYHVSIADPDNFSGDDDRYKESYKELYRAAWLQTVHDVCNRYLVYSISRSFFYPKRCARKILRWTHWYEKHKGNNDLTNDNKYKKAYKELCCAARLQSVYNICNRHLLHRDKSSAQNVNEAQILQRAKHFISAHTHNFHIDFCYADSDFIDPETGKPKIFHFHNMGAAIRPAGPKLKDGTRRINRHCFNPLSIFMDSDIPEDPDAKIMAIISFKWPRFRWTESDMEFGVSERPQIAQGIRQIYPEGL